MKQPRIFRCLFAILLAFLAPFHCRGEAMLQLFNVNWDALVQKMPEIAEAGYTSLWLPPPAKAGSVFSVGYDLFDPFDLGDKNQRGTVRTMYGTKSELLQVVETAHRFGIRVYFDNIMNHRGFDVPGFNSNTPTNLYPAMRPQDFHLQSLPGGTFQNWPSIEHFGNVTEVQNQPLFGLIDIANEPGSVNNNFGSTLGGTITKPSFIRQPNNPEYYMFPGGVSLGGPWRPFNGTNGVPVSEDVNAYLIRAAIWMLNETKCDGFRFDAVKHTPSAFFGDTSANPNGYTGALQAMFDYVHGYGNNFTGNGYVEADDSRNSCFDTEAVRNDAMLFGEHLGEPPGFQEYIDRGMRLLNAPYHFQFNNILGNPSASLAGLEQRDYRPYGSAFTGPQSVLFAQSHDDASAARRELQNAYNFMREGLPDIYSDGYNQSQAGAGQDPFPRHANAPYLGEFGDNKMPDLAYLHHQLSRGGTRARWGDTDIVAFERYDYREGSAGSPQDQTVVLFIMNDNYGNPGDISFDDGVANNTADTYYACFPAQNSRNQGLVVGFPPGSVLVQLSDSPGKERACSKLLVRQATQSFSEAQSTANDPNPINRKVYVGSQTPASGGGAIEFKIPGGGYVMYGYQWPEASRASLKDAITFRQGGGDARRMTVYRQDGVNGDSGFNPLYPFKMRGSVNSSGNIVGGVNISNRTYAIDIPILTNAPFDIVVRNDASSINTLIKLDGGIDLNSQMALGRTTGLDARDNRPGLTTDNFLGFEQALFQERNGPERFASRNILSNNIVSLGAETYYYTVGGASQVVNGSGTGITITNQTASWVFHDPTNTVTATGTVPASQRFPMIPSGGQSAEIWVKVGYQFQINKCFIYYTTDGTNPEGSFGTGVGSTKTVEAFFANPQSGNSSIDWWKGTIPAQNNGTQVRYMVSLFNTGIQPISDAESSGSKLYGLNQAAITNFNPTAATVWLHNDLNTNNTTTGLREGFHIVRARTFLPRSGKSSVYNTFLQTFYYDAQLPSGVVAFPATDGITISNSSYNVVIRADSTTTSLEYNVSDSDPNNDDVSTGLHNGNGLSNGVPVFVQAAAVNPNGSLDQQYPTLPREFRFNYIAVPSSGTATITVRLKKLTSSVYTNRFTTLTRTINTAAPAQVLEISLPSSDGQTLTLETNDLYTIRTCFTSTLTTNNINAFSIMINGVMQPRRAGDGTPFYIIGGPACGPGMRTLSYDWNPTTPGTNTIQVIFNGTVILSDTRIVNVMRPIDPTLDSDGDGVPDAQEIIAGTDEHDPSSYLHITSLSNGNRLIVWDSVSGRNYQVLATTEMNQALNVISPVIQASSTSTFYYDNSGDATNKFYRVQLLP